MMRIRVLWAIMCSLLLVCCSGGSGSKGPDAVVDKDGAGDVQDGETVPAPVCVPGATACAGEASVQVCLPGGMSYGEATECQAGLCGQALCDAGVCLEIPSDKCNDGDPCTDDLCLAFSGECFHSLVLGQNGCCATDADCKSGASCGEPLCDLATGACVNPEGPLCVEALFGFGDKGDGPGQLKNPKGLEILADGRVAVADSGNNRVVIFSREGVVLAMLDEAFGRQLKSPGCIHEASDGTVFVCDTGNDRVVVFTEALEGQAEWPPAGYTGVLFYSPLDLVTDGAGAVFVVDGAGEGFDEGNRLMKMNIEGKVVMEPQGKTGEGPGNFNIPAGLGISATGEIVVVDTGNDRLQIFTPELEPVFQWGEKGTETGFFDGPSDLAIGSDGTFWIVDAGNQRVQGVVSCMPDCSGRTCGDDGCSGACTSPFILELQQAFEIGECPSFGECDEAIGSCTGWAGEGGAGCEPAGAAGCEGCGCEACVCEGVDPLDPSLYYEGAASDPYCCDTEWDGMCQFECMFVCGYSCALPEVENKPPTLQASVAFDDALEGKLTAPVKIAVDDEGLLYVLDTVKSAITVYRVLGP